jgi:hypothetical protein
MPSATRLPTGGTMSGRFWGGWGTVRSRARRSARPRRRTDSGISGETEPRVHRFAVGQGSRGREWLTYGRPKVCGGAERKLPAPLLLTPWLVTNHPAINPKMSHAMKHIQRPTTETLLDAHSFRGIAKALGIGRAGVFRVLEATHRCGRVIHYRSPQRRQLGTAVVFGGDMASRFPAPWRIVEIPSGFAVEEATGVATRRVSTVEPPQTLRDAPAF